MKLNHMFQENTNHKEMQITYIGNLVEFDLINEEECGMFFSNLIVILNSSNGFIKVKFYNVKELKVASLSQMFKFVLIINDIHTRCMENIGFQVVELEENAISFYCEQFEIM